jgi:pSer/pThr/pTyr-binding forkhead associated (FHA) protein
MTLGRKNECDIVLCDDATISRNHSSITYVKNLKKLSESRFYLCDNKSKFGTLIYVKNKIQLKAKLNGLLIQSGGDTIKV